MILTLLAIILGTFVFLLVIHVLCRDDFTLFRRNISLEHIFNLAFLSLFASAFFARFFYVVFHFKRGYLNPLVFFHIFNYPGLSLTGAVIGGALALLFFLRKRKYPRARILDIVGIALLFSISLPMLVLLISYPRGLQFILSLAVAVLYFIVAVIITRIFLHPKTKEGSIAAASLFIFALVSAVEFGLFHKIVLSYASLEFFVLVLLAISSFIFFLLRVSRR